MIVILVLLLPSSALAVGVPDRDDVSATQTLDTPAPANPDRTPRPTREPNQPARTASPDAEPVAGAPLFLGAAPVTIDPVRSALSVGYYESGVIGQLPLLVAQLSGYFADAGFDEVTIVETKAALRDARRGDLDFAVAPAADAFKSFMNQSQAPAVAGFQNYGGKKGKFGGDLIIASPGLVEHEPATVIAFLSAYIRALQDLSDPETSAEALALIQDSDLAVLPSVARKWDAEVAAFAPFDGGFGSYADASGYGELEGLLVGKPKQAKSFDPFLAAHTLNIAQASVGLGANPDAGLVGPPSVTSIRVGLPMGIEDVSSPINVADAAGYFLDAGFVDVEVMDVEQPLLGLLNGELDFGVVDAVDAADGASQGLPAVAAAGHANYGPDGSYGGDVLLATTDMLDVDASTASAFLIAYLRALQDLATADATTFAAFDGGFGAAENAGGFGEMTTYLEDQLGEPPALDALIEPRVLEFAQAWWGLPANPTSAEAPAVPEAVASVDPAADTTDTTEGAA